jgi:cytochrome P450
MTRPRVSFEQFVTDPLTRLADARKESWIADIDAGVVAIKYDDVRELLSDERLHANFPQFLEQFGITSGPFYEWMAGSPLNRDGAEHVRWRTVVSRAFTPRSVERIRPFLRDAAHDLIDGFAERGSCEFVAEFADAYPSLGLCELIGVPKEDRDRFRAWSNTIGLGFSPALIATRIGEIDHALSQLLEYAGKLAAKRKEEPRDDLVTRMVQAGAEDKWTLEEVRAAIAGLVFAGHETTKNQLGWMVTALAEHPQVWEAVADGSLEPAAVVEEVMRYRSAASLVGRTSSCPFERKGEQINAGERIILSLWSANQDESIYEDPERLDVEGHAGAPHLGFGHGPHYCVGAALARAELQEALAALTTRIGCPTVEGGAEWMPPVGITGPMRLPISFASRAARAVAK